jgi:type I site-specific restriction endonuclease
LACAECASWDLVVVDEAHRSMIEAAKHFRRVNGHLHLLTLQTALEREIAETVGSGVHN